MIKAIIASVVFVATAAQADWTAKDKKCTAGVYCAEEMVCIDRVNMPAPRGMHSDYYVHVVTAKTFKSTKNTPNGKVLVDSLVMAADPVGKTPDITLDEAKDQAQFEYGNYGAPMLVDGKKVRIQWGPSSNYSKGVNLTIVSSKKTAKGRVDRLVGKESTVGDVVGSYSSKYECEALVVDSLTRVDDLTAP